MKEIYKKISPGHLFQNNRTGSGPVYSTEYVHYYNKIPSEKMSEVRYNLVKNYIPTFDKICDFGFGNGSFIDYCNKKGHNTFAYDVSDYQAPKGTNRVYNILANEFDVITFFDSLEHIEQENLIDFLSALKTKHIVVSLPWYHEFLGDYWFENWKHRKPNEHFHHFDVHGLVTLFHDAGYSVVHIGNEEDQIRKPVDRWPNILTVVGKKNDY